MWILENLLEVKMKPLKGYCTVFPLFPEVFLIDRSSREKHFAENPIKIFFPKLNLLALKVYAN